jgi:hypothetical protein
MCRVYSGKRRSCDLVVAWVSDAVVGAPACSCSVRRRAYVSGADGTRGGRKGYSELSVPSVLGPEEPLHVYTSDRLVCACLVF